jgi:hypothetical protein
VAGQGRPLFPQEGFAVVSVPRVPVSWVLAVGESTNRTVAAGMIVRESGS